MSVTVFDANERSLAKLERRDPMPDDRTMVRVTVEATGTGYVFRGHNISFDLESAEFHPRVPVRSGTWSAEMFKVHADELADIIAANALTEEQYTAALRDLAQHLVELDIVDEKAGYAEIVAAFRDGSTGKGTAEEPVLTERKYRPSWSASFRATNTKRDFFPLLSITAEDPKTGQAVQLGTKKAETAKAPRRAS